MTDDLLTRLNAAPPSASRVSCRRAPTTRHRGAVVHGGVYCTVIESATSLGASAAVEQQGKFAVGLDNLTDFVRAHREGMLRVLAVPVHQGRTGQLWTAEITREDEAVVACGRVRLQNVDLPR